MSDHVYNYNILCDLQYSTIPFHFMGLKCAQCGGYNTCLESRHGVVAVTGPNSNNNNNGEGTTGEVTVGDEGTQQEEVAAASSASSSEDMPSVWSFNNWVTLLCNHSSFPQKFHSACILQQCREACEDVEISVSLHENKSSTYPWQEQKIDKIGITRLRSVKFNVKSLFAAYRVRILCLIHEFELIEYGETKSSVL